MDIPEDDLRGFVKCDDANTPGMIRVSFGIYNTEEEVDEFLTVLSDVLEPARIRTEASSYKAEY
jgi:selenocysteine lyase/cysteine desulfurase